MGEHRRGHGGLYAAVARGQVDAIRLRRTLAEVPLPRAADGRLILAIDVTCWLRPDAHTSPQRILCHTYGRGKDQHIPVPGWPYSIVCALEPGRSSWTAPLDALRLTPGDDTATAQQLRDLVERLITAGQWSTGDPDILIVADAGYDAPRLAFLLEDLPVQSLARMRSDRVLRRAAPSRQPHARGGHPGTVASSSSGSPTPGAPRTPKPSPTHASTAPPPPVPGTACTLSRARDSGRRAFPAPRHHGRPGPAPSGSTAAIGARSAASSPERP